MKTSHHKVLHVKVAMKLYMLVEYADDTCYTSIDNPIYHCYLMPYNYDKVSKGAKIRNRYNQVQHLTQDTNGKVTNSQLYTKKESKEVSPFLAGDHKAQINRRLREK